MISRRKFIKNSALVAGGFTIVPRHVLGGKGFIPPSDKVNIGIVGVGGRAFGNIRDLFKLDDVQITCIADPAYYWGKNILYPNQETGRGPAQKFIEQFYGEKTDGYRINAYEDFREMLDKEKSLDGILCASPDNTHAYISIYAMKAGKHVYCEKPLTHNIWEARKVKQVTKETGVATQMGNQLHSGDGLRRTVELIRSGIVGKIREAHVWVGSTRWVPGLNGMPAETSKLPDQFNWDLWLGPTLWHGFNDAYAPVTWRDFWVFGNGAMGDFGCHDMDTAVWALNLKSPKSVELIPAGNRASRDLASYGSIGHFEFQKEGDQQPLDLTWYSGGLRPAFPALLPKDFKLGSRASIYVGEKGIILTNQGPNSIPMVFPEKLEEGAAKIKPSIERSKGHHKEWIDAIKGGPAASSNFDYGSRLTEIALLGVLSLRLGGQKIFWDSSRMKVSGNDEADILIREPIRRGWEF